MDTLDALLDIPTPDGQMAAAVHYPPGDGQYPAVIVAQEAFGLTTHIMDVARRLAGEGYVAIAPDLFHRAGRLQTAPYDRLAEYRDALRKGFSDDSIVADILAAVEFLQSNGRVSGPIGIVGFCMGGRVAYLSAARVPGLAGAVMYYGGNLLPPENAPAPVTSGLDLAADIKIPVLGFFGDEDPNPSPVHAAKLDDALTRHNVPHRFHSYANAGHGFFCDERDSYRADAAADAWDKTLAFLKKHLHPVAS